MGVDEANLRRMTKSGRAGAIAMRRTTTSSRRPAALRRAVLLRIALGQEAEPVQPSFNTPARAGQGEAASCTSAHSGQRPIDVGDRALVRGLTCLEGPLTGRCEGWRRSFKSTSMARALGLCVHTGWAACVVVSGTPKRPEIVANQVIEILGDAERFCFHRAAEMKPAAAREWLAEVHGRALTNAKRALASLEATDVETCAIVAKSGDPGPLEVVLASHPRLHMAEGCFYRDVFREALSVPARIVAPSSLDATSLGKLAPPPWGRDQKLAALAAWGALR